MKVLITGISGMDGSYLAEHYVAKGWEVHGFIRPRSDIRFLKGLEGKINLHIQDIRDPHGVTRLILKIRPAIIHHLAAVTYVPYSWDNPRDVFDTNVNGTINILEAARSLQEEGGDSPISAGPIVHYAASSEEFGAVPKDEIPITEETKIYPASPYGISKLCGTLLCVQYNRSYRLHTIITRAFNHDSPRRGSYFVTSQIVMQGLEIKRGTRKCFTLGNMDAVRDYTDARDIVRAYWLAAIDLRVKPGVPYNVCSGKGYSVRQIVDMVSEILQIPDTVEQDPSRMRPSDAPILVGSCEKFRSRTNWTPEYTLKDTLKWMLEKGLE